MELIWILEFGFYQQYNNKTLIFPNIVQNAFFKTNQQIKMKTIILNLVTALFIFSSCSNNQVQNSNSVIENVDVNTFRELVIEGNGIILDVRTPGEISNGYIENASTINLHDKDFEEKINLIQKDKPIYVYCRSGSRSMEAAKLLEKNGFSKVYNLNGGIIAWNRNNFPLVKSADFIDENIQQMSLSEFNEVLITEQPVLVDFHTVWCAPCRKMIPIVDNIEDEYKDKAVVMRIDVDKSKELGRNFNIQGVPVFILFKNGKEIWKHNGMITEEELKRQIESVL